MTNPHLLRPDNQELATDFLARRRRLGFTAAPPAHVRRDVIVTVQAPRPKKVLPPPPAPPHLMQYGWPPYTPVAFYDTFNGLISPPPKTWRQILREVCYVHRVSEADVLSPRQDRPIACARHEVFWRCRQETNLSFEAIGYRIGDRDHTTVIAGVKRHKARMAEARVNEALKIELQGNASLTSEAGAV